MLVGMVALDPDDSRPAYQQVADKLRADIAEGRVAPGEQLPTQRELADEYGVATETVKRALRELQAEGVIVSRQGKGSYVSSQAAGRATETNGAGDLEELRKAVADLSRRLELVERRLGDA